MDSSRRISRSCETTGGAAREPLARLLIVDDEQAVCEMLQRYLQAGGYECRTQSSSEGALDALRAERFDAVLSDLHMSGASGLALLDDVRRQHPGTAFILLTGEYDVRTGVEAMKRGAFDYVTKPFQPDAVKRSITQALERQRLERELETYRANLEKMVEQRTEQLGSALRRIEETYDSTLEALGLALDIRDSATEGHSARVTRYSLMIAEALGCPHDQLREIARGAYLHDVGKLAVPDGILLKRGKLTDDEQEVMRTHVMTGFQMIKRIPFLKEAAQIILAHQERYDGCGYPAGLQGEAIPLGARIFAIADTLDAMTSDRPYRKAMSFRMATNEIRKESGAQFDPKIVKAFLTIPEAAWMEARAACQLNPISGFQAKQALMASPPPPAAVKPRDPRRRRRDGVEHQITEKLCH